MGLPKGRFTTTRTLAESQGEMCSVCKQRVPLVYFADGIGRVCPDCDPKRSRAHLVEIVTDDTPPPPAE